MTIKEAKRILFEAIIAEPTMTVEELLKQLDEMFTYGIARIPAGKWCYSRNKDMTILESCPFSYMDNGDDGSLNACLHPNFFFTNIIEDETYQPVRCSNCLLFYPYGATVEIKPKERPCNHSNI